MLAVIVTVTLLATDALTANMREALGQQEYLRARLIAGRLDGMLEARKLALASLAEGLPAPEHRTAASVHDAMLSQHTLTGAFLNIALFRKSGEIVYSAQPAASNAFVASTRPYFIEAILSKRDVVSQPFVSALSGQPVIVLARPVLDAQGDVEYLLTGSIALNGVPLASEPDDDERVYYVMTTEGYLVSHPQQASITHHVNELPELSPAAAIGLQGFQGWRYIESTGSVHAFARLKLVPMIVGLRVADTVAFRSFTTAHDRLVLGGTALAACALLAAWLVSLLVRQPASADDSPSDSEPEPQPAAVAAGAAAVTAPIAKGACARGEALAATISGTPARIADAAGDMGATASAGHAPSPARIADTPSTPATQVHADAESPATSDAPPLDLDAFMQRNFTSDEQRSSFIATVAASTRKLPAEAAAVSANLPAAPPLLHTLKGAWGSLGAVTFARAAGELEAAIKQQRPTSALLARFTREAAVLQGQIVPWLATRDPYHAPAAAVVPAPAPPSSAQLLPLLRERNINASALYESSRQYWNAQLGDQAPAFSAAMDALDFSTAERLLADTQPLPKQSQRS
jgi:HPt (histidine-containing phosphotransfer) domain-containing protein